VGVGVRVGVGMRVGVGVAVAGRRKGSVTCHSPQEARSSSPNSKITLQMWRGAVILLIGSIIAVIGRIVKRTVCLTNPLLYVRV